MNNRFNFDDIVKIIARANRQLFLIVDFIAIATMVYMIVSTGIDIGFWYFPKYIISISVSIIIAMLEYTINIIITRKKKEFCISWVLIDMLLPFIFSTALYSTLTSIDGSTIAALCVFSAAMLVLYQFKNNIEQPCCFFIVNYVKLSLAVSCSIPLMFIY